jgi:excisionase family DNA binding protein
MKTSSLPRISPRFLTTAEAASLLNVSQRTVVNWIHEGSIPYIELPSKGRRKEYRIPEIALLESLSGNYDLVGELRALDAEAEAAGMSEEQLADITIDGEATPA